MPQPTPEPDTGGFDIRAVDEAERCHGIAHALWVRANASLADVDILRANDLYVQAGAWRALGKQFERGSQAGSDTA